MPTHFRAVAFDMDGLMFNTEDLYEEVGDTLLKRRGKRICRELLNRMMGRPSPIALRAMIDFHELDATIDELQEETAEIYPSILEAGLQPMPGLLDLLEALEGRDLPKGVCTSSRREFADKTLNVAGVHERFEFVLTADDVEHGKPAPDIYLAAAQHWGIHPNEMLVLEDSPVGCQAAVAAGAFAVAVPGPHASHDQFPSVKHIASSLADPFIHDALFSQR